MARFLGIDPGINGGIAVIDGDAIIAAFDVPVCGDDAKRRVDVSALMNFLAAAKPDHAFIERAQAMPSIPGRDGIRRGMGASSSFNYGRAVGALEASITAACVPMTLIEARAWKKYFRLPGGPGGKEASRQRVLQLYPRASSLFRRKQDHQRAEAVLIARYGAVTEAANSSPAPTPTLEMFSDHNPGPP